MYHKDEEFGGLLGMYLEGVRQAYYPVFTQRAQAKRREKAVAEPVSRIAGKKAGICDECCGAMIPAMCGKN
jgi:hypothetical protein